MGYVVIIGKGNDVTSGGAPSSIARIGWAMITCDRHVAQGMARIGARSARCPGLHHLPCLSAGSIISNNYLVSLCIIVLGHQRSQATYEHFRALEGWHDNRNMNATLTFRHHSCFDGFSKRNEPMTSASSGDVQKHSIASRGVQTIGSPRVLNDVLTRTGTPVRPRNARSRSWYNGFCSRLIVWTRAVPSTCRTAGILSALSGLTSKTNSMNGDTSAPTNQSAASSSSTTGATGRKSSRSLTSLSFACISAWIGEARIE